MKTRVITAIVMVAVLFPCFFFSDTVAFCIAMALLSAVAVFEMLRCIGIHKNYFLTVPCIVLAAFCPMTAKLFPANGYSVLSVTVTALLMWFFSVSLFSHGKLPIDTAAMGYMGVLYPLCGFTCMVLLRELPNGVYLFLLPFIGSWVSDTFAYFTGRLFGKHKLIPDVSPKKTVEGAVGGIVFAMLAFVLYGLLCAKIGGAKPRYPALLILGLPVSLLSIVGDLVMSLVKRRYAVKDYGKLFPGHGGVLDRFDSVLATAIVLYLLCANTAFFGLLF